MLWSSWIYWDHYRFPFWSISSHYGSVEGKTSTLKSLCNEAFDASEASTHGVENAVCTTDSQWDIFITDLSEFMPRKRRIYHSKCHNTRSCCPFKTFICAYCYVGSMFFDISQAPVFQAREKPPGMKHVAGLRFPPDKYEDYLTIKSNFQHLQLKKSCSISICWAFWPSCCAKERRFETSAQPTREWRRMRLREKIR